MAKSDYITREGFDALEKELNYLWKEERPRVTQAVSDAAALGDRSENAEYIYGKKRLREIDRRIRFLSKRLDQLTVVYPNEQPQDRVFFGAWVTLEDETGEEVTYRIVGPDEFDPHENKISVDSPVSKALLGKPIDEEVTIQTPSGRKTFYVVNIVYSKH